MATTFHRSGGRVEKSRLSLWSWVGFVVAGSLVAAGCGSGSPSTAQLVVGEVGPSATGTLAALGLAQEVGTRLATQDINSEGGVLGKPIRYVVPSTEGGGKSSDHLVNNGVDAVIGVPTSNAGSFDRTVRSNRTVQCLPNAYGLADIGRARSSSTFETTAPEIAASPAIADLVKSLGADPVAIAYPNNAEGSAFAHAVVASLYSEHIAAKTVSYDPVTKSFVNTTQQLLQSKPKVVIELSGSEGAALTRSLLNAGVPPSKIVGGPGMFFGSLPAASGLVPSAFDGMHVIGPGGDAVIDEKVGLLTGDITGAAQAYDCAVIIALAAEQAGSTDPSVFASHLAEVTTGSKQCTGFGQCRDLIRKGRSVAYTGVAGPLRLDAQNQATSVREVTAVYGSDGLSQVSEADYPVPSSR